MDHGRSLGIPIGVAGHAPEAHDWVHSLDIAELVMEFEDQFDLNIPEDEEGIQTVGDAVNFIEQLIKKKESGE